MPYEYPGPNPYEESGDLTAPSMNAWMNKLTQGFEDLQDMQRAMFGVNASAVVACTNYGLDAGAVVPESPEAMQVEIKPMRGVINSIPFKIATEQHPTFTAPTGDPRIDLIAASAASRAFVVRTGYEAPSPVAPSLADDEIALAYIYLFPGMAAIYASEVTGEGYIEDQRTWLNV